MSNVLVSIIMPCYNSAHFIGGAICSVVNQSYQDWELLICDDESTDGSRQIAEDWVSKDPRIKVLQNRFKKGAPGARNTSLSVARGRYIAFLDADDLWNFDKLEKQISHMRATGSLFSVTYYNVINEEGQHSHVVNTPNTITKRSMMYSNFVPCLTAVYDSGVLGKVYQPNIKKRNDYALWLTLFREKGVERATSFPEVLASYRQNGYGLSSSKFDALKYFFLCLRRYGGKSRISAVYFTCIYLMVTLIKKRFPRIYNFIVTQIV